MRDWKFEKSRTRNIPWETRKRLLPLINAGITLSHTHIFLDLHPDVPSTYLPAAGGVGEGDAGHGGAVLSQLVHPQGWPARALNTFWNTLTTVHRAPFHGCNVAKNCYSSTCQFLRILFWRTSSGICHCERNGAQGLCSGAAVGSYG